MGRKRFQIVVGAALAVAAVCTGSAVSAQTPTRTFGARDAAQMAGVGALPAGCNAVPAAGHARCFLYREPADRARVPHGARYATCAVDESTGYTPCNIQSAYSLTTLSANNGKGSTVAVVDAYDDPNAAADLATFRSNFGLPPCTTANKCFKKLNQTGQQKNYPTADAGWAGEISLDLDMVSADCPNCHIWLVEANSSGDGDLFAADTEAVKLGAKIVSDSWGSGETTGEQASDSTFDEPGVAFTFSSGDGAYQGGVQYPAASNYVTSVGGTELTPDSGVSRGWDESTWVNTFASPPTQGSGSGCSADEGKPQWQTDAGCPSRTAADVSMVAANVLGYDTYQASGWYFEFGTSVSTPLTAGLYGLAHNAASIAIPVANVYTAPAKDRYDITTGSTGTCTPSYLCNAGPGYDGPTGLGTPNGIGMFKLAKSSAPTVSSITLGGSVSSPTITVAGTNFGRFSPPGSPEWDCGGTYSGDVFGGVGLNVSDTTAGWGAGSGGDCLGVSVTSWSTTTITLAMGNYYANVTAMQAGDAYAFELQGHTFSGTLS